MFKLLRVHQYIKNLLIFAPLLFSFNFLLSNIIDTILTFILFSLLASSVYIFNDYMDIEEDKQHPKKRYRPLASGEVSKYNAKIFFVILTATSLIGSYLFNLNLFLVMFMYLVINIMYSFKLKHIAIIDLFIIGISFVLRLFAGASVIENQLSMWIIIMTFLLALFLAVAKRRDDVVLAIQGKETRKNIDGYNLEFVNASMVFMSGVIVVTYILYTVSSEVLLRFHTQNLYLTSIFVIVGIMRYMQITFVEENSGDPTNIFLNDKFLQLTFIFWFFSFFAIVKSEIYFG